MKLPLYIIAAALIVIVFLMVSGDDGSGAGNINSQSTEEVRDPAPSFNNDYWDEWAKEREQRELERRVREAECEIEKANANPINGIPIC